MRYFVILIMFLCNNLLAQSPIDSIVIDLPKYVPCSGVIIYLNENPIDTQTLTPNFTPIDYSALGMSEFASPDYPDYTRVIRNYITLGTPSESIDIRVYSCVVANPGIRIYKKHFNSKIEN